MRMTHVYMRETAAAAPATMYQKRVQTPGQSVPAPNVDSVPIDNMVRAFTIVQIMAVQ
jgi:hypothetical protein